MIADTFILEHAMNYIFLTGYSLINGAMHIVNLIRCNFKYTRLAKNYWKLEYSINNSPIFVALRLIIFTLIGSLLFISPHVTQYFSEDTN